MHRGPRAEMADYHGARVDGDRAKSPERRTIAGVSISHPHRLILPELKLAKEDLALYFQAIADWVVPHVQGRPLTLLHCPNGLAEPCVFLRHRKAWGPNALRRVRIREKTKVGEYLVADDLAGIVGLVQMGVVEIHTWNSVADDVERPNRIVWDLDPGPSVNGRRSRRQRGCFKRSCASSAWRHG